MASGEWRVASGEWRVASGEWREVLTTILSMSKLLAIPISPTQLKTNPDYLGSFDLNTLVPTLSLTVLPHNLVILFLLTVNGT